MKLPTCGHLLCPNALMESDIMHMYMATILMLLGLLIQRLGRATGIAINMTGVLYKE